MAAVKLSHRLTGAKIEVADKEAAKFWTDRGFVAESGTTAKKTTAKKAAAKKSS
jgi:hypothetical protein